MGGTSQVTNTQLQGWKSALPERTEIEYWVNEPKDLPNLAKRSSMLRQPQSRLLSPKVTAL